MAAKLKEIHEAIDRALRESRDPITAADLMSIQEVREAAQEKYGTDIQMCINRVSDLLGFMWRRGAIKRYAAIHPTTKARWAYGALDEAKPEQKPISPPPIFTAKSDKPRFIITEGEEETVLEFENVKVIIRSK